MYTAELLVPLIKGYTTGTSLIVAVGAQNAFVLRQGIAKSYVFIVALLCSIIDALMITAGVKGVGVLITGNPTLLFVAKYGGSAFLFYYGAKSFYNAMFKEHDITDVHIAKAKGLKATIITLLAMTLLNPHLYLDTMVLIGSIGAQFYGLERSIFLLGAIIASFVWFFVLSYGAGYLAPLFKKPTAWKILDVLIGIMMWGIAISLIL